MQKCQYLQKSHSLEIQRRRLVGPLQQKSICLILPGPFSYDVCHRALNLGDGIRLPT